MGISRRPPSGGVEWRLVECDRKRSRRNWSESHEEVTQGTQSRTPNNSKHEKEECPEIRRNFFSTGSGRTSAKFAKTVLKCFLIDYSSLFGAFFRCFTGSRLVLLYLNNFLPCFAVLRITFQRSNCDITIIFYFQLFLFGAFGNERT